MRPISRAIEQGPRVKMRIDGATAEAEFLVCFFLDYIFPSVREWIALP